MGEINGGFLSVELAGQICRDLGQAVEGPLGHPLGNACFSPYRTLEASHQLVCSPGIGSKLEVRTAVTHTIDINKPEDWADLGGRSPNVSQF